MDKLLSSELSEAARETGSLWDMNQLVSSANKISSTRVDTLFKSLILSKKNKGPKMEPWGTPQQIVCGVGRSPLN